MWPPADIQMGLLKIRVDHTGTRITLSVISKKLTAKAENVLSPAKVALVRAEARRATTRSGPTASSAIKANARRIRPATAAPTPLPRALG